MRERRLRKLFLRFRQDADVDALTEVFNETAPVLMSLARHLVGASGDAEDVVQATFLTAIEQAEKYDPDHPLKPWLTGILVRKARRSNERRARTLELGRVELPPQADPAQRASLAEFTEALKRALAGLPPRYRSVLQPFLQDGEQPRDIARREGVPAGTVRVRIHRGLDLLRKALPAGYAGAATASLAELQRVRAEVRSAARAAVSAGIPTGGGSTAALLGVGPRALTAAAVVVAAGAGVWQLARPSTPSSAGQPEPAPSKRSSVDGSSAQLELESGSGPESLATTGDEPREPATAGHVTAQGAGSWKLVADVRGFDGTLTGDLVLRVRSSQPKNATVEATITENGPLQVELAALWPATFDGSPNATLEIEHEDYAPLNQTVSAPDPFTPGELTATLELARQFSVLTGRAVAESGVEPVVAFFPAPGEKVALEIGRTMAGCDSDGSFRLLTKHPSGWFVAAAEACAPSGERLELGGFPEVDLGFVELGPGATISGVAYSQGRPEPGLVLAENVATKDAPRASLLGQSLALLEDNVEIHRAEVRVEPAGDFRFSGLTPGWYDVLFVPELRTSGYFESEHGTRVEAPAADLELDSPIRTYTFRVVSGELAVADAMIEHTLPSGSVMGPTRTDGSYLFTLASNDVRHPVTISKPGFATREMSLGPSDFDSDGSLEVELDRTVPPSRLALELSVEHGPIGQLGLRMTLEGSNWYVYRSQLWPSEALDFGEVPAGSYHLEIWPELDETLEPRRQGYWMTTELEFECEPSSSERVPVPLREGGRAAFHLLQLGEQGAGSWFLDGPDGSGPLWLWNWSPERSTTAVLFTPQDIEETGEYWLSRALSPGEYRLGVRQGGEARSYSFLVTAGAVSDVVLD